MPDTSKEALFDKRTVERNIRKGLVTREEYNAWRTSLGDRTDVVEVLSYAEEGEDE